MSDAETGARNALLRRANAAPLDPVAAGRATARQVLLGPDDGMPNFALRRFVMGEGGGMPRHTNTVEHEQYVLRGLILRPPIRDTIEAWADSLTPDGNACGGKREPGRRLLRGALG